MSDQDLQDGHNVMEEMPSAGEEKFDLDVYYCYSKTTWVVE